MLEIPVRILGMFLFPVLPAAVAEPSKRDWQMKIKDSRPGRLLFPDNILESGLNSLLDFAGFLGQLAMQAGRWGPRFRSVPVRPLFERGTRQDQAMDFELASWAGSGLTQSSIQTFLSLEQLDYRRRDARGRGF